MGTKTKRQYLRIISRSHYRYASKAEKNIILSLVPKLECKNPFRDQRPHEQTPWARVTQCDLIISMH